MVAVRGDRGGLAGHRRARVERAVIECLRTMRLSSAAVGHGAAARSCVRVGAVATRPHDESVGGELAVESAR